MKNLLLLSLLIIVFITTGNLNAQLQSKFTAKQGLNAAQNQAKSTISDAELMIAGTIVGAIPNSTFTVDFDLNKGTSTVWMYQFRSKTDTALSKTYIVTKLLTQYVALEIDLSSFIDSLPINPLTSLEGKYWFDSDSLSLLIRENQTYKDYASANKDAAMQMCGLSSEPITEAPVWGVIFTSANGNLGCFVDANTGDVFCQDFTSVPEVSDKNKIQIYPNPANTSAIMFIPSEFQSDNSVMNIYNSQGELVKNAKTPHFAEANYVVLDFSTMNNGIYFVNYNSNGKSTTLPVTIVR